MGKRRTSSTRVSLEYSTLTDFLGTIDMSGALPNRSALREKSKAFHDRIIRDLVNDGRLRLADIPGGRRFLHMMWVNYLRHMEIVFYPLLSYRKIMDRIGDIGDFTHGYTALNNKILDTIVDRYPFLRDACNEQRAGEYFFEPEDIFKPYMIGEDSNP